MTQVNGRRDRVRVLAMQAEQQLAAGDAASALLSAVQAVALDPTDPQAQTQRGQALMQLDRPSEAVSAFQAALVASPEIAALHLLLGNAHRAAGCNRLAVPAYAEAVRLAPDLGGAWRNFGLALLGAGDAEHAVVSLRRACALEPQSASSWNSLGAALHALALPAQALCAFSEAARLAPDTSREGVRARWNQSLLYLLTGDMERGWPLYDYRRTGPRGDHPAPFGLPVIKGWPAPSMRVLVCVEQGLGDVVMILRFLPLLAQQGVRIILQRPSAFRRLLTNVPGVESFLDDGMSVPDVDGVLPCMSLPPLFVDNDRHVPGDVPYLHPDPALAAQWETRLAGTKGLRVGFVWAGNPNYALDRDRSVGLSAMLPLMSLAGLVPVCLQVGPGRRDLATLPLLPHAIDLGAEVTDMADTLAVLSRLDVLVSCCTMPVHLAGAVGLSTQLLIPAIPDWRWGLGRADSSWYPSVTLYRQGRPSDWSVPLAEVGRYLSRRIGLASDR